MKPPTEFSIDPLLNGRVQALKAIMNPPPRIPWYRRLWGFWRERRTA